MPCGCDGPATWKAHRFDPAAAFSTANPITIGCEPSTANGLTFVVLKTVRGLAGLAVPMPTLPPASVTPESVSVPEESANFAS